MKPGENLSLRRRKRARRRGLVTTTTTDRIQMHSALLERTIELTQVADAKAAPLVGLEAVLAGTVVSQADRLGELLGDTGAPGFVPYLLAFAVFIVSAIASLFFAALVYLPRNRRSHGSVLYFEDIAAMSLDEFQSRSREQTDDDIEDLLLEQIHQVSQVASRKMLLVRWSFIWGFISILGWAAVLAFVSA